MRVLRVVRVLLVVIISTLLIQSLVVRITLGLDCYTNVGARLLGSRARGRVGSRRARLEHGGILDVRLRNVSRVVWSTIVLVLRIRIVVVGNRRRRELLWTLTTSRLRLTGVLGRVLRCLGGGWWVRVCRGLLLTSRKAFDLVMTESIPVAEPGWLSIGIIEAPLVIVAIIC